MKTTAHVAVRWLLSRRPHRGSVLCALGVAGLLVLLAGPPAGANDVYSNIGPAPQLPSGALAGRYPLTNYQLDQYFPAISVGLTSGVDVSGVAPLIAYFIAQVIWMITAFLANAVITLFALAFNLDLLNGNGSPGSGALTPVATAIHNLYASTFGAPWLVAMIVILGCWAMWKALVQRRYTQTAAALAVSLLYCVLAIGIITEPQRTIAPASRLSNQLSTALLSLTSQGTLGNESQAKSAASDQLFELLILNPWTVLEFGGIEHCTTASGENVRSVAVRPLSSDPGQDTHLAGELEGASELQAQGKTCINDRNKYASHFLAFPFQSSRRNSEHQALEKGSDQYLPASDPGKTNGSYPLGNPDKPAAEAMGKGGQYQRLLLSIVILLGELGAFLLLGALAVGVLIAGVEFLFFLAFAPVALLIGMFPGRGHEFFRAWLAKLAGYLARKVIYSLILVVTLAVCRALDDATSNLGWLLAFTLQAAFLWSAYLKRNRLTADFLGASVGPKADHGANQRLQALYYTTRLARMAMGAGHRRQTPLATTASAGPAPSSNEPPPAGQAPQGAGPSPTGEPPSGGGPPEGGGSPQPAGSPPSGAGSPSPNEQPTHGAGAPAHTPPVGEAPPQTGEGSPAPVLQTGTAQSPPQAGPPTEQALSAQPTPSGAQPAGAPHPTTPASSPPSASSHTPIAAPYTGPPLLVPGTAPSSDGAVPANQGSLLPAPVSAPTPGPPATEAGREQPPRQENPAVPRSAAIPADDPVALLLEARQTHTATDPANQGENIA